MIGIGPAEVLEEDVAHRKPVRVADQHDVLGVQMFVGVLDAAFDFLRIVGAGKARCQLRY